MDRAKAEDAGLTGPTLAFKLRVVKYFDNRFEQAGGTGLLRKLIEAIDVPLKSILGVVGAHEGIAEIKDALGCSLDTEG